MSALEHMSPGAKALADKYANPFPMSNPSDGINIREEFHNQREPVIEIQSENNAHRIMLYLAASGHNAEEIAGITSYTAVHVRTIMKQDWFTQQLARLIDESGRPIVEQILQQEGKKTLQTLLDLRDADETPASTKAAVCFNILDRAFGKPVQKTESVNTNINKTGVMTLEELKREEERLDREERRLKGAV